MTVRGTNAGLPGTASSAPVGAPRPASAVAATLDPRERNTEQLTQLGIGRPHPAQLLARFDDGSFLVRIANAAVRANLPAGAKVGDTVVLTLAALTPRPTFLLGETPAGSATSLSPAARLIDSLLQRPGQEAPLALAGRAPLLATSASASNPLQMASSLRDTLAYSGLFYESHLRLWANGERSLAQLLREPQARPGYPGLDPGALAGAGADEATLALIQSGKGAATLPAPPEHGSAAPDAGLTQALLPEQEAAQLVRQQLDALEQQRILWQGELWPGQALEWSVAEDAASGQTGQDERAWQSVLRLELPGLGRLEATLHLAGGQLRIAVQAGSEAAAAALSGQGNSLATAMEAAGAPLAQLTVRHDPQPGSDMP